MSDKVELNPFYIEEAFDDEEEGEYGGGDWDDDSLEVEGLMDVYGVSNRAEANKRIRNRQALYESDSWTSFSTRCLLSVGFGFFLAIVAMSAWGHEELEAAEIDGAKKYRLENQQRIVLLGERHSGIVWLQEKLIECYPNLSVTTSLYRDGAFFQEAPAQDLPDSILDSTIILAVFRNVYDWVEEMRLFPLNSPAHWDTNQPMDWKSFVTKPWTMERPERDQQLASSSTTHCQEHFSYPEIVSCLPLSNDTATTTAAVRSESSPYEDDAWKNPMYEMQPDTGSPFESLIHVRAAKIRNFVTQVPADWKNVMVHDPMLVVHYETLIKGTTHEPGLLHILNQIQQETGRPFSCDLPIDNPTFFAPRSNHNMDIEFYQWINENVDWEAESLLGYRKEDPSEMLELAQQEQAARSKENPDDTPLLDNANGDLEDNDGQETSEDNDKPNKNKNQGNNKNKSNDETNDTAASGAPENDSTAAPAIGQKDDEQGVSGTTKSNKDNKHESQAKTEDEANEETAVGKDSEPEQPETVDETSQDITNKTEDAAKEVDVGDNPSDTNKPANVAKTNATDTASTTSNDKKHGKDKDNTKTDTTDEVPVNKDSTNKTEDAAKEADVGDNPSDTNKTANVAKTNATDTASTASNDKKHGKNKDKDNTMTDTTDEVPVNQNVTNKTEDAAKETDVGDNPSGTNKTANVAKTNETDTASTASNDKKHGKSKDKTKKDTTDEDPSNNDSTSNQNETNTGEDTKSAKKDTEETKNNGGEQALSSSTPQKEQPLQIVTTKKHSNATTNVTKTQNDTSEHKTHMIHSNTTSSEGGGKQHSTISSSVQEGKPPPIHSSKDIHSLPPVAKPKPTNTTTATVVGQKPPKPVKPNMPKGSKPIKPGQNGAVKPGQKKKGKRKHKKGTKTLTAGQLAGHPLPPKPATTRASDETNEDEDTDVEDKDGN